MKKVCLIGPVYPYKGGIAHYTGLLYRELAKKYDVTMVSYKMQYPKILFHREQRDFENDTFKIEDTQYLINTANPFNIISVGHWIKKQRFDMVIIQWWHPYFSPCYWLLCKSMGKQNIVYTCHNILPHERFPMDVFFTRSVLKKGSHFVVHAKEEAKELTSLLPSADFTVTPHPTYNVFQFEHLSKEEARKKIDMGSEKRMLLFFGFVREYKGLKYLLQALPKCCEGVEDIVLYVVGDFAGDKDNYMQLIKQLHMEDKICIVDGYVPDREVEKYFAASDLVVLPYESATQSGIVQIAYGFEKPVVVTNVGGLPDVVIDQETGYVVEAKNPNQIADAIIQYFCRDDQEKMITRINEEAYRFSWERMGEVMSQWI